MDQFLIDDEDLEMAHRRLAADFGTRLPSPDDEPVEKAFVDKTAAKRIALANLTAIQTEAVTHGDSPLLVLAGAGTGKTKVLTSRIAWLIAEGRIAPHQVLAVTFTRKAAREMRLRLAGMIGPVANAMDVGTFHSIAARLLRDHAERAGLQPNFAVIDADDARGLAKQCYHDMIKSRGLAAPEKVDYNALTDHIECVITGRPVDVATRARMLGIEASTLDDIVAFYQREKRRQNVIDYSDILAIGRDLLKNDAGVRTYVQQTWRAILVDEYQDTNTIQQEWLNLISDDGDGCHLTCVGDDDQGVYSFRGAQIKNILSFPERFADAKVIRLEENFRSTGAILNAANAIISTNTDRHGKTLYTQAMKGARPRIIEYANAYAEQDATVAEIKTIIRNGVQPSDIAVISRAAMELGPIQMTLATNRIPFVVTAGRKFAQMQDVKTITSYLRILINPADDIAFQFIVEAKPRGYGKESLIRSIDQARISGVPLRDIVQQQLDSGKLRKPAEEGLRPLFEFLDMIGDDHALGVPLQDIVNKIVGESGVEEQIALLNDKADQERDQQKAKSLKRQAEASRRRIDDYVNSVLEQEDLAEFVDSMSLLETEDEVANSVWLGTIHAAKGLEFPYVYLIGWEDDIFPSQRAVQEGEAEEETRLAYVAVTRAKKHLTITVSRLRQHRKRDRDGQPNKFAKTLIAQNLCEFSHHRM
jgi:DNA helicase II / ATP-dependent DNA helicase PcrA